MRTRALRPVRQERNRHKFRPKLTQIDLYSPLVDTRDRFGKRVGIISQARKLLKYKAFEVLGLEKNGFDAHLTHIF